MIEITTLEKLEFGKVLLDASTYCQTEPGKTTLLSFLPLTSVEAANEQGQLVTEAKCLLEKDIRPPIEFLIDLSDALAMSRIEGGVLSPKQILGVLNLAVSSRLLSSFFQEHKEITPALYQLSFALFRDKLLEHQITSILLPSGEVKDNASKVLADIRSEIHEKEEDLRRSVVRILRDLTENDYAREEVATLRDGRVVVAVKAEHKRHVRGFVHSESATGQTVFIEPESILQLNNDIVSLMFAERREIDRLLRELTKRIGAAFGQLNIAYDAVTRFDTIFARAHYSVKYEASFPAFSTGKRFLLLQARHPLLLKRLGKGKTVPFDLSLDESGVLLITGPNAGGKTVILKSIGLLCALAASGFHIPVSPDSSIPLCDSILIDIGDEQSLEDDLSTFSSHLTSLKKILDAASASSLILLDEIGTGTDPAAGVAIASSILQELCERGSFVFATTHLGELKLFANAREGFLNASMEFDTENLIPTYRLKQGIPGSSYAFEIARRIGFSEKFLNTASSFLRNEENHLEEMLIAIQNNEQQLRKRLREAELESLRLSGLTQLYEKKINEIKTEKNTILKKYRDEAEDFLVSANKLLQKTIKELKESSKSEQSSGISKENIKEANNAINSLVEKTKNIFAEEVDKSKKLFKLAVNDSVVIRDSRTQGRIVELHEEKGTALIQAGAVKMQVQLSNLEPASKTESRAEKTASSQAHENAAIKMDIRGERPDEIKFDVIKFLDRAYAAGLTSVEILHGKGTGALKNMIQSVLKTHPNVVKYYFASAEFGGEGITIVELMQD